MVHVHSQCNLLRILDPPLSIQGLNKFYDNLEVRSSLQRFILEYCDRVAKKNGKLTQLTRHM